MPADPDRAVLLRRIEAVDGPAEVSVVLDLRAGFGRGTMKDLKRDGDVWTGRSVSGNSGGVWFRWSGAGQARPSDGGLSMKLELAAGAKHELVLEISDADFPAAPPQADRLWASTEEAWCRTAVT